MSKILKMGNGMIAMTQKEHDRLYIEEENGRAKSQRIRELEYKLSNANKEIARLKARETKAMRESRKQLEPSSYERRRISRRVVVSEIGGFRYGEY